MYAADIMSRAIVTVPRNASILDAMRLMLEQRISGLPVVDESGQLAGILTEGDLLRRVELGTEKGWPRWRKFLRGPAREAQDYVRTHGRKVEEVMTRSVKTATKITPLEEVVDMMETNHIKRVPVIGDHDRLVGVVSRADLLRALAKKLGSTAPAVSSDTELRERVMAELQKQNWGGRANITVVVTDGVTYLEGTIFDASQREAIRVAAENVPGVKGICDHLDYWSPNFALGLGYGI